MSEQQRPYKRDLYRFPWSSNDNPIGWLEVTDKCNIYCRGCYRINGLAGHKTLAQIKEEIDLLQEWRNCDNISIAGGEPLIHPNILDIISYIRERGMKPHILTNGVALERNPDLLKDLKRAGAVGLTFHVDSEQNRPHWKNKTEIELNELRLKYARMVAEVGGLFVNFGMTVYPTNYDQIPEVVRWANKHIDIVHGLVFITFRGAVNDGSFNYFVNGQRIQPEVSYMADSDEEFHVTSKDVYAKIQSAHPHYDAAAYLGGTASHTRMTWLVAAQVGRKGKMYGSIGPKTMEMVQTVYHWWNGRYMVYKRSHKLTKLAIFLSLFDKNMRKATAAFFKDILRNPLRLFRRTYIQTIGIVQGPDMLEDGSSDMCESCPDMTVWEGKLVYSCRMDEWRKYGNYVIAQRTEDEPQVAPIADIEAQKN